MLQDSIDTSVNMKLFRTRKESAVAHIFESDFVKFRMSRFKKDVDNFDPARLKSSAVKAYPLNNRPRGNRDITSVKFHQRQIRRRRQIQPVWLLLRDKTYILLDGAHRIVANYIEKKRTIPAYIIRSHHP